MTFSEVGLFTETMLSCYKGFSEFQNKSQNCIYSHNTAKEGICTLFAIPRQV